MVDSVIKIITAKKLKAKIDSKEGFRLVSINLAGSKKNFPIVTRREYGMVVVDETQHLKNRNTLNWELVNSLKMVFIF
jgi:hypothetical protein